MTTKTKVISISSVVLILLLAGFIYFRFYFVFGEGVKAGDNYLVYKVTFKTYEGKLIQSGFIGKTTGAIQSYEFKFGCR